MALDNVAQSYALLRVMKMWGHQDANAAMAHIESMEIGQMRTRALSELIGGVAQEEPYKAAEMAISLTNLEERRKSMIKVMDAWPHQDIEGAWASSRTWRRVKLRIKLLAHQQICSLK